MREFLILFNHERRELFPSFSRKRGKTDIAGTVISVLITLAIAAVFVYLIMTIADSYVLVKQDKVRDPVARSHELLNFIYSVIMASLSVMSLEKMRNTLARRQNKELFLRMPVKPETIFLSKLCALLIWNYIAGFVLIASANIIFFIVLNPSALFWLRSLLVWLFMPLVSFLIASLFIVPYIFLIDFISNKYLCLFILLSLALVGSFVLYAQLLALIQGLFETGSIKFLFSQKFITALQTIAKLTYPANCFASITLGRKLGLSILIVFLIAFASAPAVYFITKRLYHITLYKNDRQIKPRVKKKRSFVLPPFAALLQKEFISVFREPRYLFSYFAMATAMPIMVYSCYTLFETLIFNAIGISISFPLALVIMLVFSTLTNTFCATNVTRDGITALKTKSFPIKASSILLSKVLFCDIVSTLSVIVSTIILGAATALSAADALICAAITVLFSLCHIFLSTRIDLNHARVSATPGEAEAISNKTIAKAVAAGLLFALITGFSSLFASIFSSISISAISMKSAYIYVFPLLSLACYACICLCYYFIGIEKAFNNLVR